MNVQLRVNFWDVIRRQPPWDKISSFTQFGDDFCKEYGIQLWRYRLDRNLCILAIRVEFSREVDLTRFRLRYGEYEI